MRGARIAARNEEGSSDGGGWRETKGAEEGRRGKKER